MKGNEMLTVHRYHDDRQIAMSWDRYVSKHPQSDCYQLSRWKDIIEQSMRLPTFYHYVVDATEAIRGVMPLVLSRSWLFGTYLTSVPFYNYAGILADDLQAAQALLDHAIADARQVGASHIELRQRQRLFADLPTKTHKVRMVLPLPASADELWHSFKSKLRSQIKRTRREKMEVKFGGQELLSDFYTVFAINMRDLGTPVWSVRLFQQLLEKFPEQARICAIYYQRQAVAAGLLLGFKDYLEIPSASALRKFNNLSPNMLLYWSALEYASNHGYRYFDFGRSSPDSGTYKFKKQWGALAETLHWQYWLAPGRQLPELNPQSSKYRLLIKTWQKIPVALTRLIGPWISRKLP